MDKEIGNEIAEGLGSAASAPIAPAPEPVVVTPAAAAPVDASAAPAAVPDATLAPVVASPSTPAAPEPGKQEPVPLATFLDMRDENKRLKADLAKATKAKPTTPAAPAPSFKDDPDGFAAYLAEQTTRTAIGTRFEVSELTAREKHGDDVVTKAMEWGMQRSQESPAFAAEYLKQANPIAWAVKQQKRAALIDEIGDNEDAFIQSRAEKLGYVKAPPAASQPLAAAPAPQQPASPATPTRSLAAAPSASGPVIAAAGPLSAFDALTPGR